MPMAPLLAAYLLCAGLALAVLAGLLYLQERHNLELRGSAWLLVALGVATLASASLAWLELRVVSLRGGQEPPPVHAEQDPGGAGRRQ